MEPTIKSEPCEDLYKQDINNGTMNQHNLKRLHQELEDNSADGENINYHNFYNVNQDFHNSQRLLDNLNYQENIITEQTTPTINGSEGQPLKRKRLEENVLFNPPFFKLVEELSSSSIATRCYTCGKIVKGNRGISSNFIKHMKRSHPEVNKIYESYKAHKMKAGLLPIRAQMIRDVPQTNENGDTNPFLMLEATTTYDSSDENDDSLNAPKEMLETNENSKESQQQPTLNHQPGSSELSAKTLEAIGNIFEEKFRNFVSQKDYEQLNEKVNNLIKENTTNDSTANPSILELKTELDNLKKECSVLRMAVHKSQASRRQLQNEMQTVDKLLHQRKLIIKNIQVNDPKQPIKSVEKLLRERLNLDDIKIINCCVIPRPNASDSTSNKEWLSIELESSQACKLILRQMHKLKNTGIFIENEISTSQRKRKNKLMVLRKELLKRKPELKVLVRDITLIVNGNKFYWDDGEGLCHECNREDAIELNGVEYLKIISDLDLKEFINVLHNYNVQIA